MTRLRQNLKNLFSAMSMRSVSALMLCTLTVLLFAYFSASKNLLIIVDDSRVSLHETYLKDAMLALREAGVEVGQNDVVRLSESPVAGTAEVVITRSYNVTVRADGKLVSVPVMGGTVADALSKAGVTLGVRDEVSPDPGLPTSKGMEIVVSRVNVYTETIRESIPYEIERRPSIYIDKGTEIVKQEGKDGLKTSSYYVTTRDGVEVGRELVGEETITAPVSAVIEYGCGGTVTTPDGTVLRFRRVIDVKATAYTTEGYADKTNALGRIARPGTIAVDPRVIPLKSRVYVTSRNGKSWVYGQAVCEDTGGAIKGNIIDLFFNTRAECSQFGKRSARVYILE